MKKEMISCPAQGDCNPTDCRKPEKRQSCPDWIRYQRLICPEENPPLKSIPAKTNVVKRTRGKDLTMIEQLLTDLRGIKDAYPPINTLSLISWKVLLLANNGNSEINSCAYIRVLNPDGSLPHGANIFEAVATHKSAKWIKEEHLLNKHVLDGIVIINTAMNDLAADLLTNTKIKQWLVDRMGPRCRRLLPDWEKYQKKDNTHNKPDFEKSRAIFDKFIGRMPLKELGYNKKNYHDLRYRIVPHGKIVLLEWLHNLLFCKIDVCSFFYRNENIPDPQKLVSGLLQVVQALPPS
ncbi:MAG: hypothetical protein M0Z52_02035 [Actinomycetota bacterium]|nr:hypothetical protein [Actinomycetota bacterium]